MQKSDTESLDTNDFEVLEKSIRETERGSWFLDEFSKRQSFSEISMLSKEIRKMEQRISSMLRKQIIDIVMHEISGIKAIVTRVSNKFEDGSLGQSNDYRNIIALETLKTIRKKLDNITSAYLLRYYETKDKSGDSERDDENIECDDDANTLNSFIDEQKRFLADDLLPKMITPEQWKKTDTDDKQDVVELNNEKNKKPATITTLAIDNNLQQDKLEQEEQNQQTVSDNPFEDEQKEQGEEDAYQKFLATDFKDNEDNENNKDKNDLNVDNIKETDETNNAEQKVKNDDDEMDFSLNNFDPRFGI